MDSCLVLKWHIRLFKLCGLWPPENGSTLYSIWMVFFNWFVNVAYPISQIACGFWIESVDRMVDYVFITSSVIMVVIKGFNVLAKKKYFVELLRLIQELDATITTEEYEKHFKPKFQSLNTLLQFFTFTYMGCWVFAVSQDIVADPSQKTYSSTYFYPSEFLHQRDIYTGGIMFQWIANLCQVIINIFVDTYGAWLTHILGGHIEVLSQRLQSLGINPEDSHDQEKELIKLCKKYLLIIRLRHKWLWIILKYLLNSELLFPTDIPSYWRRFYHLLYSVNSVLAAWFCVHALIDFRW